jgi:serine/threonine protein kinase
MDIYGDWHFIGRGGFARVFKARRRDGMYVAVKIPLFMDPAIGKSFISEIQNWTRLSHRNIVRILDYNIIPIPYFEMELCDGSLDQFRKPVNPLLAASLVFDICEGLKYCHAEKIVHRDLKPQNILMKNAIPKLSDWGLSKVLSESNISSTMISFSPYYAAPEQVKGIAKDQRVDIWQAGVILYELTTGVLPFKGENVVEIIANITTRDPAPPSRLVPGTAGLEPVILKCLRKDPMNRFQSVVELQAALGGYLKETFLTLLDESLAIHDNPKTAVSCAELVQILLKMNDATMAGEFASFLKNYVDGELSSEVTSLVEKINRVPHSAPTEIPDDLLNDAKVLVSQVKKRRNKKYD